MAQESAVWLSAGRLFIWSKQGVTIIYLTISWLAGIWLASAWNLPIIIWLTVSLPLLLGAFLLRRQTIWSLSLACCTVAALGAARYTLSIPTIDASHIAGFNGTENLVLTGIIDEEPQVTDDNIDLILAVDTLRQKDQSPLPLHGNVLVKAERYPLIPYGAQVQMTGDLDTPLNFDGFDYRTYLARQDIFSIMREPEIEILATNQGNPLVHFLLRIKAHNQETINRLLPEPQAALLSGILLGNEQGIPDDLAQDFQVTGMTHIIAISGFNIAIVAGILLVGSRYFVAYRTGAWMAIFGVAIYTIFVGAEASVVRAAAMASFVILATQIMGRPIFFLATVFTAALFMTLINPQLLWDVGFQLSFAATLGLVIFVGPWNRKIETRLQVQISPTLIRRLTRLTSDMFLVTATAILLTLPISLFHFGRFSVISPLSNLMILPAQPGVMLWGGLATILGSILPILGQIPAWIAWLFLSYTIGLVRFFANLPITTLPVSFPLAAVALTYSLILAFTWLSAQGKDVRDRILGGTWPGRIKRAGFVTICIAAILLIFWFNQRPDGKLHVVFFDVGQGDATFIQTPDGNQILIDGGQYSSLLLDKLGGEMPFWDKDMDILVATHPDRDHFLGLIDVINHYQVGTLITNGEPGDSPDYDALLAGAEENQIPIHPALAGEVIELDNEVHLEILHPGPVLDPDLDNNNSVSMRLVYGDFSLLLTGDAEASAERKMLAAGRPLQALIYKAGHHGANTSSSKLFLEAIRPQYIVISAGEGNQYGHPHDEMLERAEAVGAAVLRTDQQGTIEIISDGQGIWWETTR